MGPICCFGGLAITDTEMRFPGVGVSYVLYFRCPGWEKVNGTKVEGWVSKKLKSHQKKIFLRFSN